MRLDATAAAASSSSVATLDDGSMMRCDRRDCSSAEQRSRALDCSSTT